jgi:hypothetical protein
MIDNNFEISVLKEDFKQVYEIIKAYEFDFPVFLIESETTIGIEFVSVYEEYEFIKDIEESFTGYDFVEKLVPGEHNIKMTVHRSQAHYASFGVVENPLDETFFLVKTPSKDKREINPEIGVFHRQEVESYFINIINDTERDVKGFRTLNDYENYLYGKEIEPNLYNTFHRRLSEAYEFGLRNLKAYVIAKIKTRKNSKRKKSK